MSSLILDFFHVCFEVSPVIFNETPRKVWSAVNAQSSHVYLEANPLMFIGGLLPRENGQGYNLGVPSHPFCKNRVSVILWPGQPKKRVRIVSPVISLLSGMGEAAQGELRCHLGCSCLVSSVTIEGREWPSWALSFWLLFLLPFMVTEVIEERNSSKKLSSFPPPPEVDLKLLENHCS